jgi:hypothetical protein
MNLYRATLSSDQGPYTLRVYADSEEAAIRMILAAENCPLCGIKSIKLIPKETPK